MLSDAELSKVVCDAVDDSALNALDDFNLKKFESNLDHHTNILKAVLNNNDEVVINVSTSNNSFIVDFLIHDKCTEIRNHKQFIIEGENV